MITPIVRLNERELKGKKVLVRVDFNVPVENGRIQEIYRIKSNKETIDFLADKGASVTLLSHITAIESFEPIASQIKEILGVENFALMENVRKYEGEEKNDPEFAKKLAEPFDIYVNNAFSVSHRNHASVAAITKFLPSYAGLLFAKEVENLDKSLNLPKEEKTLIIGGVKIETKFPVIKNFLDKAENILIGGAVANVFLKARGVDVKKSLTDDRFLAEAEKLIGSPAVVIPEDYIFSNDMILDVGPKTIDKFSEKIKKSKTIIWNGLLGKAETEELSRGTKKIAETIANSGAFSIVGGGDTIAYLEKINLIDKFDYISTGGGAMLQFLAGETLPGLVALEHD